MRPGSRWRLRSVLVLVLVAVLLHQIDFWGFGFLFFERTPTIPGAVLVWFIQSAIRTGLAIYALTRMRYIRPGDLGKTALILGYFIMGVTGITTGSVIHLILGVYYYPEILDWILPYRLITGFTQEAARIAFEAAGIPYNIYLLPYGFLMAPLFTELPRLILYVYLTGVLRARKRGYVCGGESSRFP